MSTATRLSFGPVAAEDRAATGSERRPRPAPVFIHDAVIPWRGETLLLTILRAQADQTGED